MTLFRTTWRNDGKVRPGRTAWFIHKECYSRFEIKLANAMNLETFVRENMRKGFLMRLLAAPHLYKMKKRITGRRLAFAGVWSFLFRRP